MITLKTDPKEINTPKLDDADINRKVADFLGISYPITIDKRLEDFFGK